MEVAIFKRNGEASSAHRLHGLKPDTAGQPMLVTLDSEVKSANQRPEAA